MQCDKSGKIKPTYRQYEQRKLGWRKNRLAGIAYMCKQSLRADTFARFWQNWNPLFSYYLLYYCYAPLIRFVPRAVAVVATFAICGAVHDLAATAAKGEVYVLFTFVFSLFGLLVLLEGLLRLRLTRFPPVVRPIYHLSLIVGSFFLARALLYHVHLSL